MTDTTRHELNKNLAQMLKGGVIMDVTKMCIRDSCRCIQNSYFILLKRESVNGLCSSSRFVHSFQNYFYRPI